MTRVISPEETQIVTAFAADVGKLGLFGRSHTSTTVTSILVALHYARQLKELGKCSYQGAINDLEVVGATTATVSKWAHMIEEIVKVGFDLDPVYAALDAAHDERERAEEAELALAEEARPSHAEGEQQPIPMDVSADVSAAQAPSLDIKIDPQFLALARELCARAGLTDAPDALVIGALRSQPRRGGQYAYAYPEATLRLLEALDVDATDCLALLAAHGLKHGADGVEAEEAEEAAEGGGRRGSAAGAAAHARAALPPEQRAKAGAAAGAARRPKHRNGPAARRGKQSAKGGAVRKLKLLLDAGVIRTGNGVLHMQFTISGTRICAKGDLTAEGTVIDGDDGTTQNSPNAWAQHRIELAGLAGGKKTNGLAAVRYLPPGTQGPGERIKAIWERFQARTLGDA